MLHTIYKITNKINNKYYIGKHQTTNLDDGYMGSGKLLKKAINKYGIENFIKEILFIFDNELEMNNKEKELVIVCEQSYNLCEGGQGGFGYINQNGLGGTLGFKHSIDTKQNLSKIAKFKHKNLSEDEKQKNIKKLLKNRNQIKPFLGKQHTEETKKKMRKSKNIGISNPSYGSMWITNGIDNKKIKKDLDTIPDGWYKGRVKGK